MATIVSIATLVLGLTLLSCDVTRAVSYDVTITDSWNGGSIGYFIINYNTSLHDLNVVVELNSAVNYFQYWSGGATPVPSNGNKTWSLHNLYYYHIGYDQAVFFLCYTSGSNPTNGYYYIEDADGTVLAGNKISTDSTALNIEADDDTNDTTSSGTITSSGFDYKKSLSQSILFYYAQRSGDLPSDDNPISWRADSATGDQGDGRDLSGGWYDAGDSVKYNLPMAFSTWLLNYGFIKFLDAYESAGLKNRMCNTVRWPLEYLLKCWVPGTNTLYVQVGDPDIDLDYWGPPENMTMERPAYKVTPYCPGSDVAATIASAMASGYKVFNDICGDAPFANTLLSNAQSLFSFAKANRGIYSDCVKKAQNFYGSSGDEDNLATAAAWLYRATGTSSYMADATQFYSTASDAPWAFSWDIEYTGAALLLYEATGDAGFKADIEGFMQEFMPGGDVKQTPCGLSYRDEWGATRYASNAAFVAVVAADIGLNSDLYKTYAMGQIHYLLGYNNANFSYQIGFDENCPEQPYHRASSCEMSSDKACDIEMKDDNPHELTGALVGGPDSNDLYSDSRTDFVKNGVACDYNAGFQGAVAGLLHFSLHGNLPPAPARLCSLK